MFRSQLGHKSGALVNGISGLIRVTPGSSLAPLPCEDIARRQPSVKQKVSPHQTVNLRTLGFWTSPSPELREMNVGSLSHPVSSLWL